MVYGRTSFLKGIQLIDTRVIMQGKLFQRCTRLLYCSVLSLGGNVNTRRMSKSDMGSIFQIKKSMKYCGQCSTWSKVYFTKGVQGRTGRLEYRGYNLYILTFLFIFWFILFCYTLSCLWSQSIAVSACIDPKKIRFPVEFPLTIFL